MDTSPRVRRINVDAQSVLAMGNSLKEGDLAALLAQTVFDGRVDHGPAELLLYGFMDLAHSHRLACNF